MKTRKSCASSRASSSRIGRYTVCAYGTWSVGCSACAKKAATCWSNASGVMPPKASLTPCTSSGTCSSIRSEEHTSELQSHSDLVCRLLLEKKKKIKQTKKKTKNEKAKKI